MRQHLPPNSLVLAEYSDLPLFAGCVPVMSDPFLLTMMAKKGKWDPAPVVEALRSHKVALVLTKSPINSQKQVNYLPMEVTRAIEENYKILMTNSGFVFYLPKK